GLAPGVDGASAGRATPAAGNAIPETPAALTGHVAYLAVELGYRAQRRFELAMVGLDLRPQHYDFLAALDEFGPRSQKQLAASVRVDAARIVGMTDDLAARGLVERSVDPQDRRRNLIALTKRGRAVFASAGALAAGVEDELLAALSTAERDEVRSLLQRALGFR
ncbi:MAG: MarR family transcriptional regulator, partial [Rhodoglobus sp.]|nr:MarR family transcriptional regulator [Rhodoglobus sp.]